MCSSTLSLTSTLCGVGGQRHAPGALPPSKTRFPLYRKPGGHQGRSGRVRKISSGGSCSPVLRQLWSCSSCSVLTWPRTKRFLAVSNTEGHTSWSHIFKSCHSWFSSGHNEPLKKPLLRPCNQGVSVVKNMYVFRVITLRNDCLFSFLEWVIFFKEIRRP